MMVRESLNLPADGGVEVPKSVFVAGLGDAAEEFKFKLAAQLRNLDIIVATELAGKSLKAQMRAANRANAACAVIIGDEELSRNIAVLRDLENGEQREVELSCLTDEVLKLIGK